MNVFPLFLRSPFPSLERIHPVEYVALLHRASPLPSRERGMDWYQ